MPDLTIDDVHRRVPTLDLIDDDAIREETARITADAPEYFWREPASRSYHHPVTRQERGLWAHTLMLSTVIERTWDSYEAQGLVEDQHVDHAHAAAILHDQRKHGDPEAPSDSSTSDHELRMAEVVRDSELPDAIAGAVASHMGSWYDGPEPETPFEQLVHQADMVASSEAILPAVQGPLPEELEGMGLETTDLR